MHDHNDPTFALLAAIQAVDANFHHSCAADHPDLVAAVLQSMAIRDLAHALRESSTTIDNGIHAIAHALP